MNNNDKLRVITLSGVEEIGRNAYIVQYEDEMILIDYGIGFPEGEGYGVDYILPDYEWLAKHHKNLKGIFVTHAHLDHVGGIALVLDKLGYPTIYGSPFAVEFLKNKLKEVGKLEKAKFVVVDADKKLNVGNFAIETFHITHSIPQAYGLAIKTPEGTIVYTGDYKFDDAPINDKPSSYSAIEKIGKEGVLCALLDSTNASEPGKSKSETEIMKSLEDIIVKAKGRVVIATFSSLVTRLAGIFDLAKKHNKKIFITGRSLESNIKIAFRIGYVHPEQNIFVQKHDLNKIPDNQLIILTTGSQGEPMAALTRIAYGKHQTISLKKSDTVIISSSVIPTNTLDVQRLLDQITIKGARIINSKLMDVHVSGHAYQEDMKKMVELLKPKYCVPVHGYRSFLAQHSYLLQENGIPEENIIIPSDGSVIAFSSGKARLDKKIKVYPTLIAKDTILKTSDSLVNERRSMCSDGICSISLFLGKSNVCTVALKGLSIESATRKAAAFLKEKIPQWTQSEKDEKKIKRLLYGKLGSYFAREFRQYPLLNVEIVKL